MMQLLQYIRVDQCVPYTDTSTAPTTYIERSNIIYFTVCESIEVKNSTDEMIQTCSIKLPKRFLSNSFAQFNGPKNGTPSNQLAQDDYRGVKVGDTNDFVSIIGNIATINPSSKKTINYSDSVANNFVTNLDAKAANGTAVSGQGPMFMRGDMVTVWMGYTIDDPNSSTGVTSKLYQRFTGYIASVNASDNVILECEDFMWYFKQLRIQNGQFNTNPNLTGSKTSTYPNVTNYVIYTVDGNTSIEQRDAETYKINTLNGLILDSLNNALNYTALSAKGIWPLVWGPQTQKTNINGSPSTSHNVPMPYICLLRNPIYNLGTINIESNASFFSLLNELKSKFNQNVYMMPASSYNWTVDKNYGLPYEPNFKSYDPWVSNYINLGYNRYPDGEVYNSQTYKISLNGPDSTCISQNLTYKRSEDFLVGAYVKTFQNVNWVNEDSYSSSPVNLLNAQTGKNLKKTYYKTVYVGDTGGQVFTYFCSCVDTFVQSKEAIKVNGNKVYPMVPSEKDQKNMVDYGLAQLAKVHYSGYYGSFKTIGYPFINFGDVIAITDVLYPERDGSYLVKAVTITMDQQQGLVQEVFLDTLFI